MVARKRKIVWEEVPKQYLKEAIAYIKKSSPQNADKVKAGILQSIRQLAEFPEVHPPDKYKERNPGSAFRAFVQFSLRISYFVSDEEIRIVRIRRVKQLPTTY